MPLLFCEACDKLIRRSGETSFDFLPAEEIGLGLFAKPERLEPSTLWTYYYPTPMNVPVAPASSQKPVTAELLLFITASIWGINLAVVRHVLSQDDVAAVEPLVYNAARLLFATLFLTSFTFYEARTRRKEKRQTKTPWFQLIAYVVMAGLLYQWFYIFGAARTTVNNTALLLSTMPVWTAVLSFFFLRERLPKLAWAGLLTTFLGSAIVVLSKNHVSTDLSYLWGNVLMLLAAASWAGATVLTPGLLKRFSPTQLATISALTTLPLHFLAAAPQLARAPQFSEQLAAIQQPVNLFAIIFSGALSMGLAHITWNIGVKALGGSHAAVYQNLVILIAALTGWFLLSESVLLTQIIGGGFILVGLAILRRSRCA